MTKAGIKDSPHRKKTNRLFIDRHVGSILAAPEARGADDDLLTTREVADWLRMSSDWVAIGRGKNYGPPFIQLAPGRILYKRSAVRKYLADREFASTAEYKPGAKVKVRR